MPCFRRNGRKSASAISPARKDIALVREETETFRTKAMSFPDQGNLPSQKGHCLGPESFDLFPNGFIVLILKLFPLRKNFLDGCFHNHLNLVGINPLNIHRDYHIWTLKRNRRRPRGGQCGPRPGGTW